MNNAPIGIFDSGIGGVTIFKSIKKLLPKENFYTFLIILILLMEINLRKKFKF
jgi:hypothetical protein